MSSFRVSNRAPVTVVVVGLLLAVGLAAPGSADSLDERKASAEAKRAAIAAKLDAAEADDAELEAAVRDLDTSVTVQSSSADAAQQAAAAAETAVGSAEARLAATEARMAELRSAASTMAVQAYVHPGGDSLYQLLGSRDLSEASRREALMSHVAGTDRDVLGRLRAVREDQQGEQTDLARLRDQADERRRVAAAHLDELRAARESQVRLRDALDVRIQEYQAEVDGLARDQSNIEALLRSRQTSAPAPTGAAVAPGAPGDWGGGMIWPAGGPVTSPFGQRWGRMHTGIDLGSGSGSPIRAAKSGTVISSGGSGGYGLLTTIDHGGGLSTLYAHQSSTTVSEGVSVAQGQVIGYVGCSGSCTGPHLHFETRVGGSPRDPMAYLS